MFSFVWWIVGFYWITAGGQALPTEAPHLYWLCMVFLAFDVFFVVFCVALACVIGIAVCCCLPCIIAILYAVADQVCSLSLSPSHSLHQPSIPCPALCLEAMIKAVSISHSVGSCSIELVVGVYFHNATAIILFASQSQLVICCPKLPD
jgi:hypothetical protein